MRSLNLRKETLAELSADDLTAVGGGQVSGLSCPVCSDFRACLPPTLDYCVQTLRSC